MIGSISGYTAVSFAVGGVTRQEPPGSPFDRLAFECRGIGTILEGAYHRESLCAFTDIDEDRLLIRFEGVAPRAEWEVLSGTDKFETLTAQGLAELDGSYPVARPGSLAGCSSIVGHYAFE